MKIRTSLWILFAFLLLGLVSASAVMAQDTPRPVTQDEVDAVASQMYCPICENEPLDACYNATCLQWKSEIARQLGLGRTPEQIIDYFVTRYGQHVVGVPQDPFLRGLSFIAPILGTILALVIGIWTFRRWQMQSPATEAAQKVAQIQSSNSDDDYRARIEQDLM